MFCFKTWFAVLAAMFVAADEHVALKYLRDSQISIKDVFCRGDLLKTVQMSKVFTDSKTFVDMKLKSSPSETLRKFDIFMELHEGKPTQSDVANFVTNHFDENNSEFTKWDPEDWTENPKFLGNITNMELRKFVSTLNGIWKDLGRRIKNEVKQNSDLYSLLWVPNPFIVPGGRFREFYYWDSYWILEGLLLSEMHSTVRGMLENFAYIVDKYGHIPNGGRVYYLERSQPPFFIPMFKNYYESTNDYEFLKSNIDILDKEFNYWMENHMKNFEYKGKNYSMAVYGDKSVGPRPESYFEDVETVKHLKTEREKEELFSELKAAAESGWDFSSRWFASLEPHETLIHTKTRSIIPVDLNSLLYWNAIILKHLHETLQSNKSEYYENISNQFLESIEEILWDEENGTWYDFDVLKFEKRRQFYPSNLVPLFTNSYPKEKTVSVVSKVLAHLREVGIPKYEGGVPTSLQHTGEQWDFPNAWPPLQHMLIFGLHQTGDKRAQRLAFEIAEKWIRTNYESYTATGAMFEKYDAVSGGEGHGGEYDVQLGFGWSNGVVMSLLNLYGKDLVVEDEIADYGAILNLEEGIQKEEFHYIGSSSNVFARATTAFVCLVVSFFIGYIG